MHDRDPIPAADDDAALVITDEMIEAPGATHGDPSHDGSGRRDFERGMSYWPLVTLGLIAANVVVFGWQLAAGALESEEAIVAAGALHRASVMAGELWRLATACFLHGSFDHLLGNCLILYIVGMACEHGLGPARATLIYAASGLAGALASLAMSPGPSVGASGAIFGLAGAAVAFLYRHQRLYHVRDKRVGFVLAAWALYSLAIGLITPLVDNAAHVGGLLAGAALGLIVSPRAARERQDPHRIRTFTA